jgi:hypothetical protein
MHQVQSRYYLHDAHMIWKAKNNPRPYRKYYTVNE